MPDAFTHVCPESVEADIAIVDRAGRYVSPGPPGPRPVKANWKLVLIRFGHRPMLELQVKFCPWCGEELPT